MTSRFCTVPQALCNHLYPESGHMLFQESYSLYNAILSADRIDFVETDVSVVEERIIKQEPVKIKKCKKSKANEDIDVVDVSDIVA
jgi:hypothetical protein